jgi:hypothetical protein
MKTLVRVIYCVAPHTWRVIVGPGIGLLDGGVEQDWPEVWVPSMARCPNGEFYIAGYSDGVPQIIEEMRTQ